MKTEEKNTGTEGLWVTFLPGTDYENYYLRTTIHRGKQGGHGTQARTYIVYDSETNNPAYLLKDMTGTVILAESTTLKGLREVIINNAAQILLTLSAH
ncbi:MAG: hypothetical protein FD123_427 [Bacteroidetes bacterium]|nr:MAG: hypothetical protein FD123_427 [Bacteroidota bacterium]